MPDPYPQHFTIEIDRENMCRYLRRTWLLVWSLIFGLFGILAGFGAGCEGFRETLLRANSTDWQAAGIFLSRFALGVGSAVSLALICYTLLSHRLARKEADALEAHVDGQYLCVKSGAWIRLDRRLHFRSIVDFACFQGPVMLRFGITGIRIVTMNGGLHGIIELPAVKDAVKVRDMLAEIDRLREDLKPA